MAQKPLQGLHAEPQLEPGGNDREHGDLDLRGPWFTTKQAARYIPCRSTKAVTEWLRRHGIVRARDFSIAKADIDRVKRGVRPARRMASASLANLRKRA